MAIKYVNLAEIMGQIDNARANEANIQRQQKQSQMEDYSYQRTIRQDADTDAMRNIYKGSIGADGSFDEKKLLGDMLRANPEQGLKLKAELEKRDLDRATLKNTNRTSDITYKVEQSKYFRDRFANVIDQQSYDGVLNEGREMGAGWVQNAPLEYNPEFIKANAMNADAFVKQNSTKPKIGFTPSGVAYNEKDPNIKLGDNYGKPEKPAIKPVVIVDPNNPNQSIIVDANDPSKKIGDSPKLPDAQKYTAKEQAKLMADKPQATQRVDIMKENFSTLKENLRQLSDHKGLEGITGSIYGRVGSVADDSVNAQALYDNVISVTFVNALQSMRESSKTGGAVGNVSDKEGDKLQNTLAALGRVQTTKQFKDEVKKAMDRLDVSMKNIQDAYDSTYGDLNNTAQTQPSNAYKSKVPPKKYPHARQAPDGNWWDKDANGQYVPVNIKAK